ncbi:GNAT family N-acetyltransferase [Hathewaya limosa]|uniref:Ribosomal protein S18 acetylase RimI-like enzyme n=1 Tax=Hathewaya limosa TaxID=1536 RepID=A0ABU0JW69_HATLI|nr:GNAT family N-acetyltransferase [Hathewaya limosa]MDQ0480339.1 ribosomal protein S18 acetylase RimI-like enzyme [Hathewaya limosa]
MKIREYKKTDELQWVRCRVLSFLDSAYFDDVLREKEHYENPSIELVAEIDNKIVGLIDIEYEIEQGKACYKLDELGGVIWHLAVLPEYRRLGIATTLLNESVLRLKHKGIKKLQAWTRDDGWVNDWYKNKNFEWKESYLHVYMENNECKDIIDTKIEKLFICSCFAHYTGENKEKIKRKFKRVHECNLYELDL